MDGNKDEAAKCLKIGKEALTSGEKAKALRFLSKAKRLDPTLPVDALLSSIDSSADEPNGSDFGPADPPGGGPELRSRTTAAAAASSSSKTKAAAYTDEQVTVIRQIKKHQKDYYHMLGLERSCTVEDVRKAYRKLSLKVHPDKNNAPGAEEAFKAVSRAFQCLSNEENRKRYDLVGSDEPPQQQRPTRHGFDGFNGFYEADFDADEIFRNFFFGGGMSPATTQFGTYRFRTGGGRAHHHHHHVNPTGNSGLRTLIQVLPVILLLLLNFLPSSDPPYSLSRSYPYEVRFETARGVAFYVKSRKFEEQYPLRSAERVELEERIEREYVSIVRQNCRVEIQRREWGWATHAPHCELLKKYEEAAAA